MKTRTALSIVKGMIFTFLLIAPAVLNQSLAASKPPNIIFILTDDQRLEDVEHMPIAIRLLRDNGMSFNNYFSNVSLCCPSRTSILRGQYAHNTGVLTNKPPNGGFRIAHSVGLENSTVATWLHARGYQTALIGKYLNQYPGNAGATYVPPGWDYWASSSKSAGHEYGEYDYTLNENGKLVSYGHQAEDYGTDVYARKANDFIRNSIQGSKPFFLYLAFYAPHAPATPAPRHLGLFTDAKIPRTKAFNEADVSTKPNFIQKLPLMTNEEIKLADAYYGRRLAALQAVDEAIGSICKTLGDAHELENTYIVFTSDNGYHLGEHRLPRGKQTAYETDIHLPLIVRGPGISKGSTAEGLVGNIDLAPTFCDIAGASVPDFVDGRSLLPIFHGNKQADLNWRKEFLVEHWRVPRPKSTQNRTANKTLDRQFEPASYKREDASEIEEEKDEVHAESKAPTGSQTGNRRTAPYGLTDPADWQNKEFGNIPNLHALRSHDEIYVEYVTGEKEFYRLTEDPDEIDNIVSSPKVQNEVSEKHLDLSRLKNAGKN